MHLCIHTQIVDEVSEVFSPHTLECHPIKFAHSTEIIFSEELPRFLFPVLAFLREVISPEFFPLRF